MVEQKEEDGLKITFEFSVFILSLPSLSQTIVAYLWLVCAITLNDSVIPLDYFPSTSHILLSDNIISQTYNRKFILLFYL